MTTLYLTPAESAEYPKVRKAVREAALERARKHNRRFAQVVDVAGRIVDVLEVCR